MKLALIIEDAVGIPAGTDRANAVRASLGAGIHGGKIGRLFGISRARLSHIKKRLLAMGWKPGDPITPELLTKARGK